MNPTWRAICFTVAIALWALATLSVTIHPRLQLVALGLAVALLPFAWDAWELATR